MPSRNCLLNQPELFQFVEQAARMDRGRIALRIDHEFSQMRFDFFSSAGLLDKQR